MHSRRLGLLEAFFSNKVINRWNSVDQQKFEAAILNVFKNGPNRIRNTKLCLLRRLVL